LILREPIIGWVLIGNQSSTRAARTSNWDFLPCVAAESDWVDLMTDDELHGKILAGVRAQIPVQSFIWGYGPVSDVRLAPRKAKCVVLLDDTVTMTFADIPIVVDGQNWTIEINEKKKKQYKLHGPGISRRDLIAGGLAASAVAAAGQNPALSADVVFNAITDPPQPLTGTLMGGDAIFNTKYREASPNGDYWGTIAYVSSATGKISSPNASSVAAPKSCVSCAHVLFHHDGSSIETTKHSSGFSSPVTLPGWPANWPTVAPTGATWPDLAAAAVTDASIAVSEKEVRGLGELQGVDVPVYQDVVAKFGVTTGLTVARDNGVVWRRLPDQTGAFFMIRSLAQQFSRPGDSGAAVVFAGSTNPTKYHKLAGFVLAGSTADDEQFYLPARPVGGPAPVPPELTVVDIEL
jgi:hypothetical protein